MAQSKSLRQLRGQLNLAPTNKPVQAKLHDKYKVLNQNRELDKEKMRSNYISKYESLKKIAYETSPEKTGRKHGDSSKFVNTEDVQKPISDMKQKSGAYVMPDVGEHEIIQGGAYG